MNKKEALSKIIHWASPNQSVQVVLLTGSQASQHETDDLSDLDIAVFGSDFSFINNDNWLREIENFWVCIHEQFEFDGHTIPTRLTIFENGLKIDFSFHPGELLERIIHKGMLPDDYNSGYELLTDKTGIINQFPKPGHHAFQLMKPTIDDFKKNEDEFWFEIYHTAKYLKRNDLWTVKIRDAASKKSFLKMLEWYQGRKSDWRFSPKQYGRGMQNWLEEALWNQLFECFSSFDAPGSWKALQNTIKLYRFVSKETATVLQFPYNESLDHNMSSYIDKLQTTSVI